MTIENFSEIVRTVLETIENLKVIKQTQEYVTVNTDIRFKGNDTGKLVTVNVQINEDDSVEITGGDAPFLKYVQEAVKDFYNRNN